MSLIRVSDREFTPYITSQEIMIRVRELGSAIQRDYVHSKDLVVVPVLNGSFFFVADLMKEMQLSCQVSFVKVSSYVEMQSGEANALIGLDLDLTGKDVLIVEDIVDTGRTMHYVTEQLLHTTKVKSLKIATLLWKKVATKYKVTPDYVGFEVADYFLVGYGLDYNKEGRYLPHIYKVAE